VFKWNSTSNYNLNSAARSLIQTESTEELQMNASYTMDGFSFSLLGLELQNDLEFSFLGKFAKTRRATFDVLNPEEAGGEGRTLDGTTQITLEPRARYSLSNRVTASFFVRYDGTFSEGAATPGFSTTQVGFDFRINVAGGR
jgi:cell surface protein SprA